MSIFSGDRSSAAQTPAASAQSAIQLMLSLLWRGSIERLMDVYLARLSRRRCWSAPV
jgi:hypothetical protein